MVKINHLTRRPTYFFEIINKTGHSIYIQLCLNSKNLSADQKALYDQAIACSNSRATANGWKWRAVFRSATSEFGENLSEQDVIEKLDAALNDISGKQDDFLRKMKLSYGLPQQIEPLWHR